MSRFAKNLPLQSVLNVNVLILLEGYVKTQIILKNLKLSFSGKEDAMYRLFKIMIIVACLNCLPFLFSSCTHARPPKPGPNFVWVAPYSLPSGISVPGHWKHIGPAYSGKTWVPGHYTPDGTWRQGHWKKLVSPKPGKIWVPGHHGPLGRWIPGHWR